MEDDLDLALQWTGKFQQAGFDAVMTHSRAEAEVQCAERQFDVVVLDIFIRGDDQELLGDGGFTLLSRLRTPELAGTPEWGRTVPVLVVTGAKDEVLDALDHAINIGANDALYKPVDPDVLVTRVRRMLDIAAQT